MNRDPSGRQTTLPRANRSRSPYLWRNSSTSWACFTDNSDTRMRDGSSTDGVKINSVTSIRGQEGGREVLLRVAPGHADPVDGGLARVPPGLRVVGRGGGLFPGSQGVGGRDQDGEVIPVVRPVFLREAVPIDRLVPGVGVGVQAVQEHENPSLHLGHGATGDGSCCVGEQVVV